MNNMGYFYLLDWTTELQYFTVHVLCVNEVLVKYVYLHISCACDCFISIDDTYY